MLRLRGMVDFLWYSRISVSNSGEGSLGSVGLGARY